MPLKFLSAVFAALGVAVTTGLASAQTIGAVVNASPGATLARSGQVSALLTGQGLATGDVIATDRRAPVQILFNDQTRIAIGPNASFVVDDITMRSNGTARKFAVSAVAGGFRFLSGTSPKSAYSLTTPTATMGIRGTAFDFVVRKGAGTDIIIYAGLVHMCGVTGTCFRVTGDCAAVGMDSKGIARAVSARRDRRQMAADGFVFLTEERRLPKEFRTATRSCGRDMVAPRVAPRAGNRDDTPAPTPPEPPEDPGGGLF